MQVDGQAAEHVSVEELRGLLGGGLYSICELLLARQAPDGSERVFTVRALRHRFHMFDVMDGVNSPRQDEPPELIARQAPKVQAQRAAPQRSAAPPPTAARQMIEGDALDAECTRIMEGHADMLYSCSWSKADGGGRWLVSASADQTLRVWDAVNGGSYQILEGHLGAVWSCSFSPRDGGRRWVLSGSRDKTSRVFDVETGLCVMVLQGHSGSVYACEWSEGDSDGRFALTGSADKTLRVWYAETGECSMLLEGHTASVCCCAWSIADGGARWIVSGSDDETLRVWDLAEGQNCLLLEGHAGPVLCCKWSRASGGNKWILSGSWDKDLKLWDAQSGSVVKTFHGHSAPVYGCGWSPADGGARWILSGSYDESLRLWDARSGHCLHSLLGHTRWVRCCAWSDADGGKRWLASGSRDKTLRVWELAWSDATLVSGAPLENGSPSSADLFPASRPQLVAATRAAPPPSQSQPAPQSLNRENLSPHADLFQASDLYASRPQRAAAATRAAPPQSLSPPARQSLNHDEEEIKRLKAEVELLRAESFEARAEAEGAKRKLAEESKEIELIKQEVTMAISKARAEADVEKANLVGKSEAVDKMKQKYEILQVEAEEMRRRVKEEADRTRLEAEADAQELLKKTLKEIQVLKEQAAVTNSMDRLETEKQLERSKQQVVELEQEVMQQRQELDIVNNTMARCARQTEHAVNRIQQAFEEIQNVVVQHKMQPLNVGLEPANSDAQLDQVGRLEDGIGKYLSSIQVCIATGLCVCTARIQLFVFDLVAPLLYQLLSKCLHKEKHADCPSWWRLLKCVISVQHMVSELQRNVNEIDELDDADQLSDSDSTETSREQDYEPTDSTLLFAKRTPAAVRSARPSSRPGQQTQTKYRTATPPQAGYVGLKVTDAPPHAVVQVNDLVDVNFVRHDQPGYSNPAIAPGDRILKIDDMFAEHVSVDTLHSMLLGDESTPVKISLARPSGTEYVVTAMRHALHAFDQVESGNGSSLREDTSATVQLASTSRRVTRAAPPPTAATAQERVAQSVGEASDASNKTTAPAAKPVSDSSPQTSTGGGVQMPEGQQDKPLDIIVWLAAFTFACCALGALLILTSSVEIHGDQPVFPASHASSVGSLHPLQASLVAAETTLAAAAAAAAVDAAAATGAAVEMEAQEAAKKEAVDPLKAASLPAGLNSLQTPVQNDELQGQLDAEDHVTADSHPAQILRRMDDNMHGELVGDNREPQEEDGTSEHLQQDGPFIDDLGGGATDDTD